MRLCNNIRLIDEVR